LNPLEGERPPAIPSLSSRTVAGTESDWLEEAMQQHWDRVVAVLFRLLGDDAEAQDLALEAFFRLHRRGQGADTAGWLYRVAVNLGLNALRARQRRRRYESQAGLQALEQDAPADPAFTLEQAEERQRVRAALAKMKPRSASLLVLRYSGLSYAEIAAALGVAVSSVGSLLTRAEAEFERRYRGE
jgi:RNA polymerase sigma-70 factor (ECF subfamily)